MPNYIILKNVDFSYIKGRKIIKNISLQLSKNDFTAIVGPNGSGKTTLGKIIMGILKVQKGKIYINNKDIEEISLGDMGKLIGYLFQNPDKQIFASSVYDELAFPLKIQGEREEVVRRKTQAILNTFQLSHLLDSFPFNLSQGEKQRLALASILLRNPQFLILDEPTTGLDIERKRLLSILLDNIRKRGIGIVMISHDRDFIRKHGTRIIKMAGGEVVEDFRPTN